MVQMSNFGEEQNLRSMLQASADGFTTMKKIISVLVHCCLDNICEQKFKAQIFQIIQKQLSCFQKLYNIEPDLLDSTLNEIDP